MPSEVVRATANHQQSSLSPTNQEESRTKSEDTLPPIASSAKKPTLRRATEEEDRRNSSEASSLVPEWSDTKDSRLMDPHQKIVSASALSKSLSLFPSPFCWSFNILSPDASPPPLLE